MYNRELQSIDTQEKAYLLGLFYADGNVGINQTQCRIELKLEDKELIFHLQKLFPFFYIHYDRGTKIELGNYQKTLKEDLVFNGCLPRKSFENKENIHMPDINKDLIRHFIRGYFDGDGGCTLSYSNNKTQKNRKKNKFDQILSTNFFMQKDSIPCKFCDSNDTVCDGYDYYKVKKQRYLCKTCKRHFTAPLSSNIQSGGDELLES